ncbi:site-2 protease family protein [Paenibacillus sp. y28]|uniref:site-2 protease family protein n=1 Tax=Paenibacillus sp. y28 TaxID=3129110 RepID=UPI003015CA75
MDSFLAFPLNIMPFVILALIIAFTVHEFAHAFVADRFGDSTPRDQGRVTLNPVSHLDIFGTLLVLIAGFGWAKPVMVNRRNFKYPRLMSLVVSAAGPISNWVIAFIGLVAYMYLMKHGVLSGWSEGASEAVFTFLSLLVGLNMMLFVFNLIPLPPLDGYRIVFELLPSMLRARLVQYEQWSIFIFLLLVFIPPLNRVTIGPIMAWQSDLIQVMQAWISPWI